MIRPRDTAGGQARVHGIAILLTSNERGVSVSACVCLYKYRRVLVLVR